MSNVSRSTTKPENTSDAPEERSEQSQERGQELQELQPGLSQNAQPNTVATTPLKSALKKNKAWYMVRDQVEKKEVRFNFADLEMIDEDSMSPPAPGYGIKFLETQVWPGRDVDQAEVADDAPVPTTFQTPSTFQTPLTLQSSPTRTPDAANSESKD